MNHRARKTAIQCFLSASLLAFAACSPVNNDGGTQTGNPALAGIVFNQDGSRAANAKVRVARWNRSPQDTGVIADSTVTNDTGGYSIDTLEADTFNLLASSGNFMGYKDSIKVKTDSTTLAPPCTLKATGSVSGVVRLEPGDNSTNVYILFMGTNTFVSPNDSIGNFTAANLAEGRYTVKIITTLPNYDPLDTSFLITAGVDSVLPDTLRLHYTGIPVPQGLRIVYDTMKQIVTLIWDSANASLVSSYNIYRRNVGLNTVLARINTSPVTGTSYRDSTGVQDSTYEYSVAAVNASASEGTKSAAVSMTVVSAFTFTDSITLNRPVMSEPTSFAISSDLKFYVPMGSGIANHITVFNLTGDSIGVLKNDSVSRIIQVSIAYTGTIYVLDDGKDLISIFNTDDSLHGWFHILPSPTKMALDLQGNVYVTHYKSAIVRYDTTGRIIDSLPYAADDGGKMVVGADGRIYDSHGSPSYNISIFDSILSAQVASLNLRYGSIRPFLVQTVDSAGNLYVLYREDIIEGIHRDKIFVYKTTGELVGRWGDFYFDNYSRGVRDIRISGRKAYLLIDTKPIIRILSYTLPSNL